MHAKFPDPFATAGIKAAEHSNAWKYMRSDIEVLLDAETALI
jgi:hypothetical protein